MKNVVDYDVSGGSKEFNEISKRCSGNVLFAATATNLSADAVFTPLIGPEEGELVEFTDGNFTLSSGASSSGHIVVQGVARDMVCKLKATLSGTGTINTIQISD